jgi:adenylosuccinate lyase
MIFILSGLKINEERVKTNLNLLNGRQCAENLLKHLTPSLGRQKAHSLCQRLSIERDFKKAVKTNNKILQVLSKDEIDNILDPQVFNRSYRFKRKKRITLFNYTFWNDPKSISLSFLNIDLYQAEIRR